MQLNCALADGMGSDSMLVGHATDTQWVSVNGAVFVGFAVILGEALEVKTFEPKLVQPLRGKNNR